MKPSEIWPSWPAVVLQDGHVDHITGQRCIVVPSEGPKKGLYLVAHTETVLKQGDEVIYHTFQKRAETSNGK